MEETPNRFNKWEHLLSSTTPPPPATTIYTSDDPFLAIFPPVNHEGLPAAPPLDNSHHDHPPCTSPTPPRPRSLPADSCTGDSTNHQHSMHSHSPSPIYPVARWIGFALQLLNCKVVSVLSTARSRFLTLCFPSEPSVSAGGLMTGASLMVLGVWIWWRRRRRRPRGSSDDTIERLNLLIREKDEKIIELLNQVAELNKLFLARYRVPLVK